MTDPVKSSLGSLVRDCGSNVDYEIETVEKGRHYQVQVKESTVENGEQVVNIIDGLHYNDLQRKVTQSKTEGEIIQIDVKLD